MGRAAIDILVYLMDEAFERHEEHALLVNLRSVDPDGWLWLPPTAARSIYDITCHVAQCKFVYQSQAFGDRAIGWDRPDMIPAPPPAHQSDALIDWLRDAHRRVIDSLHALPDDAELRRLRRTPWGEEHETRWLFSVLAEHDLYHAGEINHLRSLRQGNDRWAWEPNARPSADR